MKRYFVVFFICLVAFNVFAQNDTVREDNKKIKTGWTFGALPVIAFDSDLGFKYGGLVNFYNYGEPSTYPDYKHSIYLEISRTTKGSGINQLFFDSEEIFKKRKIRITADFSFLTEKALDFYGFNGYESEYNPDFEDDESPDYISRMFYRHAREMTRFTLDFQGKITREYIRWLAGIAFFNNNINPVDIDQLNEGKAADELLPDTNSLYDHYVEYGIIPRKEANGGNNQYLKFGIIVDTRDIEANPAKGLWTELVFFYAPVFLGNSENAYAKMILTHRQYFTLVRRLSLVYRLGYQGTIAGDAPFYMQPYMISSYSPSVITEGLGGAKSLRGILRNRIVGDAYAFGNIEFRWKFVQTTIANQNLYLALNPFLDAGMVTDKIVFDLKEIPDEFEDEHFTGEKERLHISYGCGLHAALNENFVLSVNYGIAHNKSDGNNGLYIGTNWLF